MTYRVAINGYGRIGQSVLRAYYESRLLGDMTYPFKIVAINELSDIETIAYLTRYDTTHGRFPLNVEVHGTNTLLIDDDEILVTRHDEILSLPWSDLNIDLVLECTGFFSSRVLAEKHITSGAQRVLLSQPGDDNVDQTININPLPPDALGARRACQQSCVDAAPSNPRYTEGFRANDVPCPGACCCCCGGSVPPELTRPGDCTAAGSHCRTRSENVGRS